MVPRLAVFTDLDHTMIGKNASVNGVPEAVERLEAMGIPVIPVTAKSIYEIVETARILGLFRRMPIIAVAESGGGVYAERGILPWSHGEIRVNGVRLEYVDLALGRELDEFAEATLLAFREAGCAEPPVDVADLGAEKLSEITGLPPSLARLIPLRRHIKVFYHPSVECKRRAAAILESWGYYTSVGRNFIHIGAQRGKAWAVSWILRNVPRLRGLGYVAMGDSDHDKEMLERACLAFVIPPESGNPLRLDRADYVVAPYPAPEGWVYASESVLLRPPRCRPTI